MPAKYDVQIIISFFQLFVTLLNLTHLKVKIILYPIQNQTNIEKVTNVIVEDVELYED